MKLEAGVKHIIYIALPFGTNMLRGELYQQDVHVLCLVLPLELMFRSWRVASFSTFTSRHDEYDLLYASNSFVLKNNTAFG